MSLPEFTFEGDLPPGVHPAPLSEVLHCFGNDSLQRCRIGDRLNRLYRLAESTGHLARFVVFGSFVTNKEDPRDIDLVLIMEDDFDLSEVSGEAAILFDHQQADSYFGASVFWTKRSTAFGGEQAMIEYWQTRRDGGQRGIVEITGGG